MPTVISHAVVGWGLARAVRTPSDPPGRARAREVLAAIVPVLPDLDVVAFRLGIPYGHPLGHRGLSHSLAAATLLGLLAWAVLRRVTPASDGAPGPGLKDLLTLALAAATHGLLDMATDGGRGVAVFAPADTSRVFWPAQPIPVSPIGLTGFFARGLPVLAWEVLLLWPAAALGAVAGAAGWPTRRRLAGAGAALVVGATAWAWRLGGGA